MVGVAAGREVADRHTRDALQRLGDAVVGELAHVVGDDRVADLVGVSLAVHRLLEGAALPGDDDLAKPCGFIGRCRGSAGIRLRNHHAALRRQRLPAGGIGCGGGACLGRLGVNGRAQERRDTDGQRRAARLRPEVTVHEDTASLPLVAAHLSPPIQAGTTQLLGRFFRRLDARARLLRAAGAGPISG